MNTSNCVSISVIISTRNRAVSLLRILSSLFTAQNVSVADWEVIVADNGSTDDTSGVCRMFKERYPSHFEFFYENRGGKSSALNKSIQLCRGELLALIDDDVLCAPDYLDAIRESFAQNGGGCVVQGRVHVDYDGKLPKWFDEYFELMMCRIDLGDNICEFPGQFRGLNAVLPIEGIAKVGGFCPEMGPGAIGFGDDDELSRRLRGAHYKFIYDPRIVVRHQIASHRLKIGYVLKRNYLAGRSAAFYQDALAVPLWRYTAYIAKEIVRSVPKFLVNLTLARWNLAMRTASEHLGAVGFVRQHWKFQVAGCPRLTPPIIAIPRFAGDGQLGTPNANR
jgi:glycosyltransferase involved in cell wall biosynthesis